MPPLQGLANYNQKMLTLAEHWDEFIMQRQMVNPNIWHDRIPRGSYELFNGYEQKTNIYRGGLPVQAGLSTWKSLAASRKASADDPGFDSCAPGTPHTYTYAWETVQYSGYQDEWQSEPVCLNDMKFVDFAKEQLALVVRTGVEYGMSIIENWNREMYVYRSALANRTMVLAEGALQFEDSATYRFAYDPFAVTTDVDGASVPYIKFDDGLEVSTLNWTYLDYLRASLADRAGEASIARESGMPIFGLMIDLLDFERFVLADSALREDFRYAKPQEIIRGYDFGLKVYRGFALMHDSRQMRFRFMKIGAGANSTDDETGKVIATRVLPLKAGRAVTIGNVPEPNPAYYRAEIGIGVIFMNDVFSNLFVPSITDLGSGMSFGAAAGLTGDWKWINIPDPVTNMLGETGFFYGRLQVFPKPLLFSAETTVFAYRRCPQSWRTVCGIQDLSDVATGAVSPAATPVAGDFSATNRTVTMTLASKIDAGVGSPVTIKKDDSNTFAAIVASDALAPTYTFTWLSGASNAPVAVTEMDNITIVTVTA